MFSFLKKSPWKRKILIAINKGNRIFFFLKQSDSYINPKIQFTLL